MQSSAQAGLGWAGLGAVQCSAVQCSACAARPGRCDITPGGTAIARYEWYGVASVHCCLHSVLVGWLVGWLVHPQSTRPLACVGIFQQSAQLHQ
jgi:hypothetical protein